LIQTEELVWQGPYSWYGFETLNQLELTPDIAGVYLLTFKYKDGYILRSAGVTSSMKRRFSQHRKCYLSGQYTLLDVASAEQGERLERWHGWEYAKTHQDQYLANADLIREFAIQQLTHYRVFVTATPDQRKRERIEFSIIHQAYASKEVWGDLVDGGMSLRGRFNYEMPIKAKNHCNHKIYGLPEKIEI
jgi:hypothetical protein